MTNVVSRGPLGKNFDPRSPRRQRQVLHLHRCGPRAILEGSSPSRAASPSVPSSTTSSGCARDATTLASTSTALWLTRRWRLTEPHLPSLKEIASKLGGEVCGHHVLAPGPGHSPQDRSLQVTKTRTAPDGFLVHSFAGDDDLACKDYVRAKLGLRRMETQRRRQRNGPRLPAACPGDRRPRLHRPSRRAALSEAAL